MARRSPAARRTLRRSVRFRAARLTDLDLLVEHRLAMWRDIGTRSVATVRAHGPVYRKWVRPLVRTGKVEAVVAEVNGRPVGSGALWWMPGHPRPGLPALEPYIMSMYTDPAYRGVGLATEIVRQLLVRARARGAYRVLLHASSQGRPVYERLGFESTGEMRLALRRSPGARAPVKPRGRA